MAQCVDSQSFSPNAFSRSSNGKPNLTIMVPPLRMVPEEMTPEEDPLPPSNVLLISHLTQDLMKEEMLGLLRTLIHPHAPIWSWNLDRKHSSIKISFYDIRSAQFIKEALEREPILDCTPRIRFAPPLDTSPPPPQYLELPKSDKLFFISPPPSPPHDWEMRNEGPPNTETHAHDLAVALSRLDTHNKPVAQDEHKIEQLITAMDVDGRARSSSVTLVYHPQHHGSDPALPLISVEDTEPDLVESPVLESASPSLKTVMPKTERPPADNE